MAIIFQSVDIVGANSIANNYLPQVQFLSIGGVMWPLHLFTDLVDPYDVSAQQDHNGGLKFSDVCGAVLLLVLGFQSSYLELHCTQSVLVERK